MAEKDPETDKLELSLFRRKRKQDTGAPAPGSEATPAPAEPSPATPPSAAPPASPAPPAPAAPATPPASTTASATATDDTQVLAPTPAPRPTRTSARASGGARVAPKPPRQPVQLPQLAPGLAVLLVGAVVGLAAVAMTFASLQLCELLTSTDSCGGPGLIVLLVVVVLMILGGSTALRMLGVSDPGGLSFLGVAMFVALCLVALLPNLLEVWMILVAPILCALTFWVARWIVTRFDADIMTDEGGPPHDVR